MKGLLGTLSNAFCNHRRRRCFLLLMLMMTVGCLGAQRGSRREAVESAAIIDAVRTCPPFIQAVDAVGEARRFRGIHGR